jgi:hypothetical protein
MVPVDLFDFHIPVRNRGRDSAALVPGEALQRDLLRLLNPFAPDDEIVLAWWTLK